MKNYPTCWPGVKFEDLRQKKTLENKLNEPSPPKNKKNILIKHHGIFIEYINHP